MLFYIQTQKYAGIRFSRLMYFFSNLEVYLLEVDFQYWYIYIYFETQKYTWSRLILVYWFWNPEVYMKQTFNMDLLAYLKCICISFQGQKHSWRRLSKHVFIVKLRSILEVDFINLQIYIQSWKYNWRILFELMHLFFKLRSIFEVDFLNLCIYIQTHSCIYFQTWKDTWSRPMYLCSNSEVYLK